MITTRGGTLPGPVTQFFAASQHRVAGEKPERSDDSISRRRTLTFSHAAVVPPAASQPVLPASQLSPAQPASQRSQAVLCASRPSLGDPVVGWRPQGRSPGLAAPYSAAYLRQPQRHCCTVSAALCSLFAYFSSQLFSRVFPPTVGALGALRRQALLAGLRAGFSSSFLLAG
jgi:hypothetical protein